MLYIKFYLIFLISILFFWVIGWITKKILKIHENITYETILFNVLLGVITFSSLIAIFYTKGKTVMIFSTLFGASLYFSYRKKQSQNSEFSQNKDIKIILISLFMGLTAIYTLLFLFYTKDKFIINLYSDYNFYATLSYNIIATGVEHYYTNYVIHPSGIQTYHYLEIWLNAGIASITKQNHLAVLLLVTYPIFIFLFYVGVCALFSYVSFSVKYFSFIIALAVTFITGFSIPNTVLYEYLYKKFYVDLFCRTLWDEYHKISIIYVFLVATLILFIQKKYRHAYLVLLSMPIFFSTVLPAIYGALGIIALYLILYKKEDGIWLCSNFLVFFVGLFIFYSIFQDKDTSVRPEINLHDIRTKINIIGNTSIGIFLGYWYIPLLIYLFLRQQTVRLFQTQLYAWLIITIPMFGLLGWVVLSKELDSVQIFANITTPLLNLLAISILIFLFKYQNRKIFWLCFMLLSVSSIYKNSVSYFYKVYSLKHNDAYINKLKTVKNTLQNKSKRLGVFLRDSTDFAQSLFNTNEYSSQIVFDFNSIFSDNYAIMVNVHEINPEVFSEPHKREIAKKMIKISVFNRYVEKQKQQGRFVSIAQSQVDFIREYKATYIVTHSGYKLPDHLNALVKQKVDLGEQVLYLLE